MSAQASSTGSLSWAASSSPAPETRTQVVSDDRADSATAPAISAPIAPACSSVTHHGSPAPRKRISASGETAR
jgi:hypothetical protein